MPASSCGVIGFKPSYGQVPSLPPFNLDTYCHDGPMARSVDDTQLLARVLASGSTKDYVGWGGSLVATTDGDQLRVPGLRIGVSTALGDYPVDIEVATRTAAAGDLLREAGASVIDVEPAWSWPDVAATAWIHYGHLFAAAVEDDIAGRDDVMDYTRRFVERGRAAAASDSFYVGVEREGRIHAALAQVFDQVDVLVAPTVGHTGLVADHDGAGTVRIGHADHDPWDVAMTVPFNIASRCPVVNVPVGMASNGVPIGVQVVGAPYRERDVWRVARMLEQPFTPPFLAGVAG
jgi:aspartyl-tRNA(Asn)/glutamyl-tRNA(Gln) amidotransferase subunit A